ncbi:MAG TPA: ATP-binding protein [Gemmatimonadales bacterium]|nr:ATP-binding protein [Gemmatimonadales bacterium]
MAADDFAAQLARERALKQAEKMETVGRLTGAIAQQFNELLTAILARTATLGQSLPANKDLDALKDTAQRGAELAQRLLGFSRHRTLDLQPLILTEFVSDALDTLRRQLPAKIDVQFEVDEEAGVVEADPAAVNQILLHLVTNARDAMPKGGTLHVEVRRARLGAADRPLHAWVEPGSYVSVALSDTGVGMDAQTMARVFEPFFTTKPVGVGTGLGMSMAYGLVKQHRGYLHLYSEVGQGTTAKVYFPAVRDRAGSDVEEAADEGLPGGTEMILLVEDDQTMRLAAQQLLAKVGYRVVTAVDGQQGLDAFRAHRARLQLVITDVVMPKLSGFEMYEAIRGELRGLSVLFMSGFPAPNFRKTVGQDPHVAFVTKPWTASELLAQVRALLEAGGKHA